MTSMNAARPSVRFSALLVAITFGGAVQTWARPAPGNYTVPVVSIVATQPETREPVCPQTCLAPEPAPGVLVVSRSGGSLENSLSIMLSIGGTATPGSDYEKLPETAVIPAGQESVELYVRALFDELAEGDETVQVKLLPDPSVGPIERYRLDPAHSSAEVVIHDRTPPPSLLVVNIIATDPVAREGTNSAGGIDTAAFLIRRSGEVTASLNVFFEVGGTATNGVDYNQLPGSVAIPAGKSSVTLIVTPIDDRQREPPETVVIKLAPSPELNPLPTYTIGTPRRAAALILDNDYSLSHCQRLSDGLFALWLPLTSNGCFRIEATEDLSLWAELCSLPAYEGGALFIDPDGADLPRRSYRIIPESCAPDL